MGLTVWAVKDASEGGVVMTAFSTEDEAIDLIARFADRFGTVAADLLYTDELDVYETAEGYWQDRWGDIHTSS